MSGTVESIHKKIWEKLDTLKQYLNSINNILAHEHGLVERRHINISGIENEYNIIYDKYNLSTIQIISQYYSDQFLTEDDKEITKQYFKIIESENFQSLINDFSKTIRIFLDHLVKIISNKKHIVIINNISKSIISSDILFDTNYKSGNLQKYILCKHCGLKPIPTQNMTQLKCEHCSALFNIEGEIVDEQYNEEQKSKHGSYDPYKHYESWINKIQGKKNKSFTANELNDIKYIIDRDEISEYKLDCKRMREILKEVKLTKHNDYVPLLIKMFTNKIPPELTYDEDRKCFIKFSKIMKYYREIKLHIIEKGNRPYYPYFIYKIFEYEFRDNSNKLKILEYIHLQSDDTVCKNDLLYEDICDRATNDGEIGFIYSETNYYD